MVLGPFYTQIDTIKSPRPIAYSFLPLANMLLWGCFFIGPESDHWLPFSLTKGTCQKRFSGFFPLRGEKFAKTFLKGSLMEPFKNVLAEFVR